MIKRELDNLDLTHELSVQNDRLCYTLDGLLLGLIVVANVFLVSAIVVGDNIGIKILDIALIATNTANAMMSIRRIIRTRNMAKREKVLYENARASILKALEFEKDGYEVVIEDGENENRSGSGN